MKRALFMLLAVGLLAGIVGCRCGPVGRFRCALFGSCKDCPAGCQSVDGRDGRDGRVARDPGCRLGCRHGSRGSAVDPVPPSGVVAYPYYTTHGPRDFLARSWRSTGP